MSTVNKVEQLLKTEADDIKAAIKPAATKPLSPAGSNVIIRDGKAGSGVSQCNSPLF